MGIVTPTLTPKQLTAIVADPRWPRLARRFNIGGTGDLIGRTDTANDRAFNLAMQETTGGSLRAAFYEPWLKHFPACTGATSATACSTTNGRPTPPTTAASSSRWARRCTRTRSRPTATGWVHGIGRPPANRGADFAGRCRSCAG